MRKGFLIFSFALIFASYLFGEANLIEEAYREGRITLGERCLYTFYAVREPEKLPREFKGTDIGKSITTVARDAWVHIDEFSPVVRQELLGYLSRPTGLPETYDTEHFRMHYTTSGANAVPSSAYVIQYANDFEDAWSHETGELGFYTPPSDGYAGGDSRYDVYIMSLSGGIYGYTQPEAPGPASWNDATSFIVVRNNYAGFLTPQDECMQVTSAHEFCHSCQFAYDYGESNWWMEITSVWMETEMYPSSNDYMLYLPTFFNDPSVSITVFNGEHEYSSCVWGIYLAQRFGRDIIRAIWDNCRYSTALSAFQNVLSQPGYSSSRDAAFSEFTIWNYFTNSRATGSTYPRASEFPLVHIERSYSSYPVTGGGTVHPPDHLAANYIEFNLPPTGRGPFTVVFDGEDGYRWNAQLILLGPGLAYSVESIPLDYTGYGHISIDDWESYDKVILVPVVLSTSGDDIPFSFSANFEEMAPELYPPVNLVAESGHDREVPLSWEPPSPGGGGVDTLDYTDGTPAGYYPAGDGDILAMRFTPERPCSIRTIEVYFYSGGSYPDVTLHIWPDGGGVPDVSTDIITPVTVSPEAYPSPTVITFTGEVPVISTGDEFFIGIQNPSSDTVGILLDASASASPSRSVLYLSSESSWYTLDGDWFIIPVVRYYGMRFFSAPEDEPLSYNIWRSETNGGPYAYIDNATGTSYTDRSVINGHTYYYVVTAVYSEGESPYSNQAVAIPGVVVSTADTLIYDDGASVGGYTMSAGDQFAIRLTPDAPCQILALQYYVIGSGMFQPNVYTWTGSRVGSPMTPGFLYTVETPTSGWIEVDVSSYELYANGDFVVSFGFVSDDIGLAVDTTGGGGRCWDYYHEYDMWVETDWMYFIRAVVRYVDTTETHTISGCVYLSGGTGGSVPGDLSGSIVRVEGTTLADTTGVDGHYSFPGLVVGSYSLKASHPGYEPATASVSVRSDVTCDFNLIPLETPLNEPRNLSASSYHDSEVPLFWELPYGEPGTTEEIGYDDGGTHYYYYPMPSGSIEETRFFVWFPCTLKVVGVAFYDSVGVYDDVEVHIWADDGYGMPDTSVNLVTPLVVEPEPFDPRYGVQWTVVDLSDSGIVFPAGSEFHIGVRKLGDHPSVLSDSAASYTPPRSHAFNSALENWVETNDYLIHIIVTYTEPFRRTAAVCPAKPARGFEESHIFANTGRVVSPVPRIRGVSESLAAEGILGYNIYRSTVPHTGYSLIATVDTNSYVDSTVLNGTRYYYVATAIYPHGESDYSNEASALPRAPVGDAAVLVVDDDGSVTVPVFEDLAEYYTEPLDSLGVPYNVYEVTEIGGNGPDAETMSGYQAVIWLTGRCYSETMTLTDDDETALSEYLDGGGKLFLSAQDYLWDRYYGATSFAPGDFPYDYLGISGATQDLWAIYGDTSATIVGTAGSLAEGLVFRFRNPFDEWALYPDNLFARDGADYVFQITGDISSGYPAVEYGFGRSKTVFTTLEFSGLAERGGDNTRLELMRRILFDYFGVYLGEEREVTYNPVAGWNQFSLPLDVDDYSTDSVFPGSEYCFWYNPDSARYEEADEIEAGKSYFVWFPRDTSFTISGRPLMSFTVRLRVGWNMTGSIWSEDGVPYANASTDPDGLILLDAYHFDASRRIYTPSDVIVPGLGYWSLVTGSCNYTLTEGEGKRKPEERAEPIATFTFPGYGSVSIVSSERGFSVPALPVLPGVERELFFDSPEGRLMMLATEPVLGEEWTLVIRGDGSLRYSIAPGYLFECDMDGVKMHLISCGSIDVEGETVLKLTLSGVKPESFVLLGNFPNPFNPETKLCFLLPEDREVTLSVYNLTGGCIFEERYGRMSAGMNSLVWNGEKFPSGVYLFRLRAGNEERFGRMMLVK